MKKLFSKFLLAVLATGTIAAGVQTAASAQVIYVDSGWNYGGGYYSPYYSGFSYDPYFSNFYTPTSWGWYNSPWNYGNGYWGGNSLEWGARGLLHGLVDEIF